MANNGLSFVYAITKAGRASLSMAGTNAAKAGIMASVSCRATVATPVLFL